ncbi:MAG: S-layer homology domain-containing protein [Oscillospiraceae bacterium]|nr:S-layer homology domain-containing protein [Oscillospiraceae bacterium]
MKRIISLLLALVLCVGLIPMASAASAPAASDNLDSHYYINAGRFYHPIYSNLAYENGQYVRAEAIGSDLVVEYYDQDFKFLSGKTIPLELPVFGGVRMDSDYNFVVVGQDNLNEDDSVEVFRIIRYTKDWQKVDHTSLFGANTYIPFDAGSLRFDRSGDILYIRTCHEMYDSGDGLHHQANVMISVRISDMTVTDELTRVLNRNYGYISHSFNQFVRVDGDTLLAVDHGDALPRSVVLIKYGRKAGEEQFYGRVSYVNALPIADSTGHYNDTGVSVGGFECSSTDYLIAGSAYDMSETVDLMYAHRNIFVTATPKDNFTDEGTTVNWLTDYAESDDVDVSPPHMLKISADRFFLTWTEDDVVKYCFVNGRGQLDGKISTHAGDLSDCVPILAGSNAVWYVTDRSAPVFHQVEVISCAHSYTAKVTAPTCTAGGYTTYTCSLCGHSYVADQTAALGHGWSGWQTVQAVTCTENGLEQRACTRCGLTETRTLTAPGHNWQGTECTRCGLTRKTPFDDVVPGSYYEEPVRWAVEQGITNGVSATEFGASTACNRATVVTFLWAAAGRPEPKSTVNPFTDVQKGSFYEKAVLWAVEQGITKGTDATHFSPGQSCNRATVVTFLWSAAGKPAVTGTSPFTDIPDNVWYTAPVLWAAKEGITNGISPTLFGATAICNRAQVVTFLYKASGK